MKSLDAITSTNGNHFIWNTIKRTRHLTWSFLFNRKISIISCSCKWEHCCFVVISNRKWINHKNLIITSYHIYIYTYTYIYIHIYIWIDNIEIQQKSKDWWPYECTSHWLLTCDRTDHFPIFNIIPTVANKVIISIHNDVLSTWKINIL